MNDFEVTSVGEIDTINKRLQEAENLLKAWIVSYVMDEGEKVRLYRSTREYLGDGKPR